ncbi:TY-Chap domain-containing protein [Nocardia asteroides]|uniref:TY-Chap domain-containing protein n=1 Tax=Nocardia asteroides TaxID=1824 RepID=UPI0037C55C6E
MLSRFRRSKSRVQQLVPTEVDWRYLRDALALTLTRIPAGAVVALQAWDCQERQLAIVMYRTELMLRLTSGEDTDPRYRASPAEEARLAKLGWMRASGETGRGAWCRLTSWAAGEQVAASVAELIVSTLRDALRTAPTAWGPGSWWRPDSAPDGESEPPVDLGALSLALGGAVEQVLEQNPQAEAEAALARWRRSRIDALAAVCRGDRQADRIATDIAQRRVAEAGARISLARHHPGRGGRLDVIATAGPRRLLVLHVNADPHDDTPLSETIDGQWCPELSGPYLHRMLRSYPRVPPVVPELWDVVPAYERGLLDIEYLYLRLDPRTNRIAAYPAQL